MYIGLFETQEVFVSGSGAEKLFVFGIIRRDSFHALLL